MPKKQISLDAPCYLRGWLLSYALCQQRSVCSQPFGDWPCELNHLLFEIASLRWPEKSRGTYFLRSFSPHTLRWGTLHV